MTRINMDSPGNSCEMASAGHPWQQEFLSRFCRGHNTALHVNLAAVTLSRWDQSPSQVDEENECRALLLKILVLFLSGSNTNCWRLSVPGSNIISQHLSSVQLKVGALGRWSALKASPRLRTLAADADMRTGTWHDGLGICKLWTSLLG